MSGREEGLNTAAYAPPRAGAITANTSFVQLSYVYYDRTSSLEMHVGALDLGSGF